MLEKRGSKGTCISHAIIFVVLLLISSEVQCKSKPLESKRLTLRASKPLRSSSSSAFQTERSSNTSFMYELDKLLDDPRRNAAAYLFVANITTLKPWLRSRLRAGDLMSRKKSMIFLYRTKRQSDYDKGKDDRGDREVIEQEAEANIIVEAEIKTPVLPILGKKGVGETDCLPWDEIAVILRSPINPYYKSDLIEERTCNMEAGLECLPIDKAAKVGRPGAASIYEYTCKCMLAYGPKPVLINSTKGAVKCHIPAGLGWASECQNKTWSNYGYPLPYGDPPGANAEPAVQTDAYNKDNGEEILVAYIRWNSIMPQCVPNSVCGEMETYIGQRCQCGKKTKLQRPEGICNAAWSQMSSTLWRTSSFILFMLSSFLR